jgi:hypothetical protein
VKEIDILAWAAEGDFVIVEKESNRVWDVEEVREARAAGRFREEDRVVAPEGFAVSGPFPGCLQMGASARGVGGYHAAGQTRNFIFFVPAAAEEGVGLAG